MYTLEKVKEKRQDKVNPFSMIYKIWLITGINKV